MQLVPALAPDYIHIDVRVVQGSIDIVHFPCPSVAAPFESDHSVTKLRQFSFHESKVLSAKDKILQRA